MAANPNTRLSDLHTVNNNKLGNLDYGNWGWLSIQLNRCNLTPTITLNSHCAWPFGDNAHHPPLLPLINPYLLLPHNIPTLWISISTFASTSQLQLWAFLCLILRLTFWWPSQCSLYFSCRWKPRSQISQ